MRVDIRGRDVYITESLRAHIERKLGFALDRFTGQIREVRVMLADLNGPRGGIDKCCQLEISLAPSSKIVMEDRASNVYAAIDRLADKAGIYVGRRLERAHRHSPSARISELPVRETLHVIVPVDLQLGGSGHENATQKSPGR